MKKKVYFVRHGESTLEVEGRYQRNDSPLTARGESQAKLLGKRLRTVSVDRIITSPLKRAYQTADIIQRTLQIPLETSDLFVETKRPGAVVGKERDNPEVINIYREIRTHCEERGWHHSDEENFFDLKKRAQEALSFLLDEPSETLLVATHGDFLRMIIMMMYIGDELTATGYARFRQFAPTQHTGITVTQYQEGYQEKNGWFLVSWNDHAHLE